MALYYTKQNLYKEIDAVRRFLGTDTLDAGLWTKDVLLRQPNIAIDSAPFKTPGLRGILSLGSKSENDVILLNSQRSPEEQNFDCAHEMVHLFLHRNEDKPSFTCTDYVSDNQDPYLEWHANEGSAQFLMPYQTFIPRFVELLACTSSDSAFLIPSQLAEFYNVTTRVVNHRLENLGYEIDQYRAGVPISQIELLSRRQRQKRGITPTLYHALCAFPLEWGSGIG